jgi:hypothetical protein
MHCSTSCIPAVVRGDDKKISSDRRVRRAHHSTTQSGYILLPVVLLITLVAVAAFLLNNETLLDADVTAAVAESAQADYVAQAGLQHALQQTRQSGCGPFGDLAGEPLGAHSYTTTLTSGLGSTTSYTITVDQDAWIRSDQPTDNYATDGQLHVRYESGIIERPIYRYDLFAIPANAPILSATAWFYVTKEHPEGPVDIHRLTADWAENDATWETLGDRMDAAVLATIPTQPDQGWVQVNLTAQVQAWVNGQPNYGIALNSISEGTHADYASREHGSQPYLEVVVATPVDAATLAATGTLANGTSRSLTRDDVVLYQQPSHYEVQPDGTKGKDAMIYQWKSNWNYGSSNSLDVYDWGSDSDYHSLLQFDLGRIPHGATIQSAELALYQNSNGAGGGSVAVRRITDGWDEGSGNGSTVPGVTWNNRKDGKAWTTPGGDLAAEAYASTTIPAGTTDWFTWDITGLVSGWVSGRFKNNGLALVPESSGANAFFVSSDDTNPALRPRLTIRYACECGTLCMGPRGSGTVLMVVVNPTTLVPTDEYKEKLFKSWGYDVDILSESANQSSYDAAVAAADVVFISETVNANSVGTKLKNAPIGVVTQDGDYNPDLGFAAGSAWPVDSTINVTDTSHYITMPFAPGVLDIYSAGMEQLTVSSAEGPGLQTLADTGGAGSLVVLDTGSMGVDGNPVAGPRVMLPLGRESDFNWNHLNANGRLLVQRALQWGTGNLGGPPQNLLLVVVDPASLTAQEDAKKTLIESWGYAVNLIDESDSQANFDAAIDANDVAYIPQDITSSNLGTKLANATIGVVNEEGEQVDELGLSGGKLFKTRREIDVVDNTHYITQPFATGLLTFSAVDQSVHMLSGQIAPGLQTLGESFNTGSQWAPSLGTLDTGDTLSDGTSTAPGRRVQLPWGGGTFDINLLTDDGRTIMQRAIEWAAGAGAPSTQPIAHWTFDEGSGPTAFDSVGGNDATLNGDTFWTIGTINGALDFDGSGDSVSTDNNFTPPPVGTVTFWMKVSGSPASHGRILGLHDTWEVRHVTTGTADGIPYGLVFDLGVTGVNTEFVTTTTVDTPGKWYHIAASYDTATGDYAVYIDGVPHKSGTYSSGLSVPAANVLSMGTRTGSSNYYDGMLDDVRIYDQFLSAAEIADLAAEGGGSGAGGYYLDQFNAVAYNGNDGALAWSGEWQELGESDGPGTGRVRVNANASHCASGNCLRIGGTEVSIAGRGVSREADLAGATSAELTFTVSYSRSNGASVTLEISADGGSNWTPLATYPFSSPTPTTPTVQTHDISAYAAADTQIRFVGSGSTGDPAYLFIDEVKIDLSGGGSGNFRDEFTTSSFGNNNGSLNWAGDWIEVDGDGAGPGSGNAQISGGVLNLDDSPNTNGEPSLAREADLSAYSAATLTYNYFTVGTLENSDSVTLEISENGGSSWTTLQTYSDDVSGSASFDISPYISSNTQIRFRVSQNFGASGEQFHVDDLDIAVSSP